MLKYFLRLEDNVVVGLLYNATPTDMDGWEEVDTEEPIEVGYIRLPDGSFSDFDKRWSEIRARRNMLLAETDWTQLSDVVANRRLNISQIQEFAEYRQKLADIPQDFNNPEDVVFPTKPL